jgi:hypothetical protein
MVFGGPNGFGWFLVGIFTTRCFNQIMFRYEVKYGLRSAMRHDKDPTFPAMSHFFGQGSYQPGGNRLVTG